MSRDVSLADVRFHGEGRGAITADGCAVELYLRLPYAGEVELLAPSMPGSSVLELGCGAGRLTAPLLEHGYRVTAVDNSREMLAHVPQGATTVCADIQDLHLAERFDAAILASGLVNIPSDHERAALLAACHRHLHDGGVVLVQCQDPAWLAGARAGQEHSTGEVTVHVDRAEYTPPYADIALRYRHGTDQWLHEFRAEALQPAQLEKCLAAAGFHDPAWIDAHWVSATR
ncbi:MAG TPA: methyltransferase domain-containing protein [Usitatibacter sp.]|nr:methyltransferase domain-containing protein [Usitatibacter sp.]